MKSEKYERAQALVELFKRCGYDASVMVKDGIGVHVGVALAEGESLPVLKVSDLQVIALPVLRVVR